MWVGGIQGVQRAYTRGMAHVPTTCRAQRYSFRVLPKLQACMWSNMTIAGGSLDKVVSSYIVDIFLGNERIALRQCRPLS